VTFTLATTYSPFSSTNSSLAVDATAAISLDVYVNNNGKKKMNSRMVTLAIISSIGFARTFSSSPKTCILS